MNDFDSQMDPENDPLKTLFRDQAMEQAPEHLIEGVMSAIEAAPASPLSEKPLISRSAWALIILGFILLCSLAFMFVQSSYEPIVTSGHFLEWFAGLKLPKMDIPSISTPFLTGMFAFSTFALLHLFWLKRRLDRKLLM